MTVKAMKAILEAKPFVAFTIPFGMDDSTYVDDPSKCQLDEEDSILYVYRPEVEPPAFLKGRVPQIRASMDVVDLRLVAQILVGERK